MKVEIPYSLQFIKEYLTTDSKFLAKLGGYTDGAYTVDYRSILSSNYLISGGVGSNVRFESDFKLINKDLKLVFIDPTTSIIRMLLRACYHFFKKNQSGFYSLSELFNYLNIRKYAKHVYKYLGRKYTINDLCNDLCISNSFFLKLDIEGFEYELLDSIVEKKDSINGICIEFHDLSKLGNIQMLENFVKQLDFNIISVSINELAMNNLGQPEIIEVSFSPKTEIHWPQGLDDSYFLQNCNALVGDTIVFNYDF